MNNTYELIREQNKYKAMRENVVSMINVLSSSDVIDKLSMAQVGLKNYYLVNGYPCKYKVLENQKERISNCLLMLKNILASINAKLNNIKSEIDNIERQENG